MSDVDKNNVLTVKRRAKAAAAVQFTGKNGAEIVAFVKEYASEPSITVRNGGSYVTISFPNQGGRARKGDWVVVDSDGTVLVADPERFDLLFAIKG